MSVIFCVYSKYTQLGQKTITWSNAAKIAIYKMTTTLEVSMGITKGLTTTTGEKNEITNFIILFL
jgi:hypothetical protein